MIRWTTILQALTRAGDWLSEAGPAAIAWAIGGMAWIGSRVVFVTFIYPLHYGCKAVARVYRWVVPYGRCNNLRLGVVCVVLGVVAGGIWYVGNTGAATVYITDTGSAYHRLGCEFLPSSKNSVSLRSARRRYSACLICRPPV